MKAITIKIIYFLQLIVFLNLKKKKKRNQINYEINKFLDYFLNFKAFYCHIKKIKKLNFNLFKGSSFNYNFLRHPPIFFSLMNFLIIYNSNAIYESEHQFFNSSTLILKFKSKNLFLFFLIHLLFP
jgi:hypothetical protein